MVVDVSGGAAVVDDATVELLPEELVVVGAVEAVEEDDVVADVLGLVAVGLGVVVVTAAAVVVVSGFVVGGLRYGSRA